MKTGAVMQARSSRRVLRRTLVGLFLLTAALLLVHPDANAAKTVKVKVALTAAEDLNPDYQGRASPVNLILFQLTSADAFNAEDFFSLYDPEAAALGGDMLSRTQILLQPGEAREWEADFTKETRYVGVIAAFRDIENAKWRSVVELPDKGLIGRFFKKNKLRITVESLEVSVAIK